MAPQAKPQPRQQPTITPEQIANENAEALAGSDNDALIERGATEDLNQRAGSDPLDTGIERREPIQRSPQDDKRAAIASRFRRAAPADERPFNGDFSDPENVVGLAGQNDDVVRDEDDTDDDLAQLGLSSEDIARARGQRAAAQEIDEDDEIEPQPRRQQPQQPDQDAPRKALKINGRTVLMTDAEILDAASKTLAADAYLEESRRLLKEAKAIRAGRTASHSGENDTETTDLGSDPPEPGAQDHEPSTRSVIEKIQFGDPDEAAAELDRLVDSRAGKKASEGQLQRLMSQDISRSKKALADFTKENEALAGNRVAALAIEQGMYDGYAEDILALGISEDQIPQDKNTLANWHRFYRINGFETRSTKELLNASKDKFLKDVGAFRGQRQQQQPSRQQPRVQVNVDQIGRAHV